jgi:hypothetical protein
MGSVHALVMPSSIPCPLPKWEKLEVNIRGQGRCVHMTHHDWTSIDNNDDGAVL